MTTKHGITDAEMEGLSDAERAALEDEEEGAGPGEGEEGEPEGDAEESAGEGESASEAEGDASDATDTRDEPFAVPFHHDGAKFTQEQVDAAKAALTKRFEDGEIDMPKYLEERDKITAAVVTESTKAAIANASQEQMAEALWKRAVENFMDDHDIYRKDKVLYDALDSRVKVLAQDPENEKLSDKQLLSKAHEEIASRFKVAADAPKPKDPKAELIEKRKPNLKAVPPTLGTVPTAAENAAADDEFADIDKLAATDTAAYERRLAKMTPEEQDRYLRATA